MSTNSIVPAYGVLKMSLRDVCRLIGEHRSLSKAQIISVEAYAVPGFPTHRFLLLELHRQGRKDIWCRLDRRPKRGVMRGLGRTEANDTAELSASKEELLAEPCFRENKLVFDSDPTPTLGDLRTVFEAICDELRQYRAWPENCWFFCSLVQQHLAAAHDGQFAFGKLKNTRMAIEIRIRIAERIRVIYHMPESMPASSLVAPLTIDITTIREQDSSTPSSVLTPTVVDTKEQAPVVYRQYQSNPDLPLWAAAALVECEKDSELSMFIKSLIESVEMDSQEHPAYLPDISKPAIEQVIFYIYLHQGEGILSQTDEDDNDDDLRTRSTEISEKDQRFVMGLDQELLFDVILAANFLNIKPLLDVGCKTVANMIKGKTPEELRKLFNIANEFTPEEEAQMRKENEWAEDR